MNPLTPPSSAGKAFAKALMNFPENGVWEKFNPLPVVPGCTCTMLFQVCKIRGSLNLKYDLQKSNDRFLELSSGSPTGWDLRRSKNEFGGISIFLLCGLPLLLSLMALFTWRWAQLYDSKNLRGLCRQELGAGQEKSGKHIQALLGLNTQVQALRTERRSAELAKKIALTNLNLAALKIAQIWLQSIAVREKGVRSLQLRHLALGQTDLLRAQRRALNTIRHQPKQRGLSLRHVQALKPLTLRPDLAVQVTDPKAELPEYELKSQFSERQKMELRWHSTFEERNSSWSLPALKIPESCGMTLTKDLRTVPIQVKFFWKH